MSLFESLEIVITTRCNGTCPNCIRAVHRVRTPDMTPGQVTAILYDITEKYRVSGRVFDTLCITGGEPTLHPKLAEIWSMCQGLPQGAVGELVCNVNNTRPVPEGIKTVHWWSLEEKAQLHQCSLISPSDPPEGFPVQETPTWEICQHYRKNRIVATVEGYQLCCAAEGYTRILGMQSSLMAPRLPLSLKDFPKPDPVCKHCAFGAPIAFLERDHGCPVSKVFDRKDGSNGM